MITLEVYLQWFQKICNMLIQRRISICNLLRLHCFYRKGEGLENEKRKNPFKCLYERNWQLKLALMYSFSELVLVWHKARRMGH